MNLSCCIAHVLRWLICLPLALCAAADDRLHAQETVQPTIYHIDAAHIMKAETSAVAPLHIYRSADDQRLTVIFPNGGTETNILIYDATADSNSTIAEAPLVAQGDYSINEQPVFDMSHLPDGHYIVHYLSCGFGGGFSFIIHSE